MPTLTHDLDRFLLVWAGLHMQGQMAEMPLLVVGDHLRLSGMSAVEMRAPREVVVVEVQQPSNSSSRLMAAMEALAAMEVLPTTKEMPKARQSRRPTKIGFKHQVRSRPPSTRPVRVHTGGRRR